MRFYKDIIDNLENVGNSAKHNFHEWSPQSIKFFWNNMVDNPAIQKQFYPLEYWEALLNWASTQITSNPSEIADIGCGNGNLINVIRGVYPKAVICGVDLSEESLGHVKERFMDAANISFKVGSLDQLPFPDNSLDLITCTEVLEHTFLETFINSFSEIRRVLKEGGYYLASVPFDEKICVVSCPKCGSVFTPYQHMIFEITRDDVSQLLARNGLELVKFYHSIDRSEPSNFFKRLAKSFLINYTSGMAKRLFPMSGVKGFLARACPKV